MRQRKILLRRVLITFVVLGTFLSSVLLYKIVSPPQPFLIITSPGGTYTIHLTGQKNMPRLPAVTHSVRFSAWKDGKVFLSGKHLHSGDWFDPSFEILYPHHQWVGENVLRFYRERSPGEGPPDTLVIINTASENIDYLRVDSVDGFLLFDVAPETTTTLSVSPSRGDLKWTNLQGIFSGGRLIKENGVDIKVNEGAGRPLTYYISIAEDGSTIESTQAKKYKATN